MLEQSLAAHFNNGSIAPPETAAASRLDALVQVHVASAEVPVCPLPFSRADTLQGRERERNLGSDGVEL
jgi:hypothetical protein